MSRGNRWTAILALCTRDKTPTEIARGLGCSQHAVYQTVERWTAKAPLKQMSKPSRTEGRVGLGWDLAADFRHFLFLLQYELSKGEG